MVIENGCDFKFWTQLGEEGKGNYSDLPWKCIAFYQGGINRRIDFRLMHELVRRMPDWEFWFCGEVAPDLDEWASLCRQANVKYFGKLKPEEVRTLACRSSVGLLPFVQTDLIIERSFPLKAFEYVASGLPVVCVPIKSLLPFASVIAFANTAEEFIEAMHRIAPSRHDSEATAQRLRVARSQDYDVRFEALLSAGVFQDAASRPMGHAVGRFLLRARSFARSFLEGRKVRNCGR